MEVSHRLLQHLAAIVEDSDDAILTKDLGSIIQSWNHGAEELFGFTAEEAIGKPITIIFPHGREGEEADIIDRIRCGERIAHFETLRQRKDGSLVPISVTISPMRDKDGRIVGASKIARDITLKRQFEEQQRMLLSEMRHRVRNSFAIAGGLLRISAQQTNSIQDLLEVMQGRFQALSQAHELALPHPDSENTKSAKVNLAEIISSILRPFLGERTPRIEVEDCPVADTAITPLALVLYELCTNAVKYGGLSGLLGDLAITSERNGDRLRILWRETSEIDGPGRAENHEGFGTMMSQMTIGAYLDGSITREFTPTGLQVALDLSYEKLVGHRSRES